MKRWNIIILCIVSIGLMFLSRPLTRACSGPGDWEPMMFFSPYLQKDLSNKPFFLSSSVFYNDSRSYEDDDITPHAEKDTNLKEWSKYLGGNDSLRDIGQVIYKLGVDQMMDIEKGKNVPDSLKRNSCLTTILNDKKYKDALPYVVFAKECEPYVTVLQYSNEWGEGSTGVLKDTAHMLALANKGIKLYNKCTDGFIKLRYGYQITRLAEYCGDYNDAVKYYDKYVAPSKVQSDIKNWAMLLKAVALLKLDSAGEGNYLLSVVFNNCREKKTTAFHYFKYNAGQSNIFLEAAIGCCKTDKEKAVLYAMNALYAFDASPNGLLNVYKYDPNTPLLENLLIREVDKVEGDATLWNDSTAVNNNADYSDYGESVTGPSVGDRAADTLEFDVDKFIAEKKMKNVGLLYLIKTYLVELRAKTEDNIKEAGQNLDMAKKYCNGDRKLQEEWHLLSTIHDILSYSEIDTKAENDLMPDIEWLCNAKDKTEISSRSTNVITLLARRYMDQGNEYMASIVSGSNGSDTTLESLDEFYKKYNSKNKGPVEKWFLLHGTSWATQTDSNINSDIYFREGMIYLREHDYSNAAGRFSFVSNNYFKQNATRQWFNDNPFAVQDSDTHAKTKDDTVQYTQYAFCEKMLALQNDSNNPQSVYQYANALYNMTFYGNSWILTHDFWSATEWGDMSNSEDDYYNCTNAKAYYLRAMSLSKNKEFKAKCCFMAAKCEQKELGLYEHDPRTYRQSTWMDSLYLNYKGTKYYANVLHECSLLRDFVAYQGIPGK